MSKGINPKDYSHIKNRRIRNFFKIVELYRFYPHIQELISNTRIQLKNEREQQIEESFNDPSITPIDVNEELEKELFNISSEIVSKNDFDADFGSLCFSEREKSERWFKNTIDIPSFNTKDHNRLRRLFLDNYSAHKSLITKNLDLNNVQTLNNNELNELLRSYGFPYPQTLHSRETKIGLILSLIGLYKIKGTKKSVSDLIKLYGFKSVEIVEWWLENDFQFDSNNFIFRSYPVNKNIPQHLWRSQRSFQDFIENEPQWRLGEDELRYNYETKKTILNLPSLTNYISIRNTIDVTSSYPILAIINRKMQESYEYWTHYQLKKSGTVERVIRFNNTPPSLPEIKNDPPSNPSEGDRYVVGSSPTGSWSGESGKIATWKDIQWNFEDIPDYIVGKDPVNEFKKNRRRKAYWDSSNEKWAFEDIELLTSFISHPQSELFPNRVLEFRRIPHYEILNDPPQDPEDGDKYEVGEDATMEWANQEGKLAVWNGDESEWEFEEYNYEYVINIFNPLNNWAVYNKETESHFVWRDNLEVSYRWIDLGFEILDTQFNDMKRGELSSEYLWLNNFDQQYNVFEVMLGLIYLYGDDIVENIPDDFLYYNGKYAPLDSEVNSDRKGYDDLFFNRGYGLILDEWEELNTGFRHVKPNKYINGNIDVFNPRDFRDEKYWRLKGEERPAKLISDIFYEDENEYDDKNRFDLYDFPELPEGQFHKEINWEIDRFVRASKYSGQILEAVNPKLKDDIDSQFEILGNNLINKILLDFEEHIRTTMGLSSTSFSVLLLGNEYLKEKTLPAINHFKPLRTIIKDFIFVISISDPLGDSILSKDIIEGVSKKTIVDDPAYYGFDSKSIYDELHITSIEDET